MLVSRTVNAVKQVPEALVSPRGQTIKALVFVALGTLEVGVLGTLGTGVATALLDGTVVEPVDGVLPVEPPPAARKQGAHKRGVTER